jgi:hypothetical protein
MSITERLAHDLAHAPLEVHIGCAPIPLRALVAEALMAHTNCGMLEAVRRADALITVAANKAIDGAMRAKFRELTGGLTVTTEISGDGKEPA